jgi:2-iminoacetate synthase ThiH
MDIKRSNIMSNITLTPEELEIILDRAAKRGAKLVLRELGLHDESAAEDMREVRNLLTTWRQTRLSIWNTFVKITTVAIFSFVAAAIWMKLGN